MPKCAPSVDSIFLAALEKSSPEDRAAYLDVACGEDTELRRRVERLLAAHPKVVSFLESPPPGLTATLDMSPIAEQPGQTIGRYKLREQIGEGGMGVVYMAEQREPVRRKVALKIIKAGMDTQEIIARFEAERQALAVMDHPSIAKVLDGGATESGRPYFVMELVNGMPITEYCDKVSLPTRERLKLFVSVCQAVQHAHQKGIIHRDLKPSNIMVTLYDGVPVPKIIDFGIAKALHQPLTEKSVFTRSRPDDGHAALHEPRAGRNERPGRRHPQRHLLAGRVALRTAQPAARPSTGSGCARRVRTKSAA